jgi:ABC-type microcin C transport system duplicated ATPase subunit YejF
MGLIFQEPMTRLDPLMRIGDHFTEELKVHEPDLSRREARDRALEPRLGNAIDVILVDYYDVI